MNFRSLIPASLYSRKCSPPSLLPLRAAHRALADRGLAWAFISRTKSPGRMVAEFPSRPTKRKHVSRSGCRQHLLDQHSPPDIDVNIRALDPSPTAAREAASVERMCELRTTTKEGAATRVRRLAFWARDLALKEQGTEHVLIAAVPRFRIDAPLSILGRSTALRAKQKGASDGQVN
jgi:hypothetical protein